MAWFHPFGSERPARTATMDAVTDVPTPQPFAYLGTPNAQLYSRCWRVLPGQAAFHGPSAARGRPGGLAAEPDPTPGALAWRSRADVPPVPDPSEPWSRPWTSWSNGATFARTPTPGRVTTVEDFNRARKIYQLTRHGQAALAAIEHYEQALGLRGRLQTVALADIAEQLVRAAGPRRGGGGAGSGDGRSAVVRPHRTLHRSGRQRRGLHVLASAHGRLQRRRRGTRSWPTRTG